MKFWYSTILLALVVLAPATVRCKEVEEQRLPDKVLECGANVDNEVDKLFRDVRERFPGRITLDDREGTFELRNGYISGLHRLERIGPVNLECSGNNASAFGIIQVKELKGGYDWKTSIFGREISGTASLIAEEVDFKVLISQLKGFGNKPQLDQLKVTNVKNVRVELTGIGRISNGISRASSFISNVFKRQVARVFETRLRNAVIKELKSLSFPIQ